MAILIKPREAGGRVRVVLRPPGDSMPDEYALFRNRIKIDRDALDKAVEEQAQVFLEVCDRHVHALSKRDEIRDKLARRDAEIAREVRRQAEKGKTRATEAMINDSVLLHIDHVKLNTDCAELKKQADLWSVLRDAFDQRMRMIRELVNLYAIGYYGAAGTVTPRNTVRDSLAATARTKMDEDRKARR